MIGEHKMIFEMPAALRKALGRSEKGDAFVKAMTLRGKPFRDVPGRKTSQVELLGKSYFIKQHFGVGWGEIVKSIISLKKPILGAMTEVDAIQKVTSLGIATTPVVAYGKRGCNPANTQSFLLTEDLGDITSLEELCAVWKENPPDARYKRHLVIAVAKLARNIHEHGVNHRDFYLCHLCLHNEAPKLQLYLIDLHRALIHKKPSKKANMKDIAALYFSAMGTVLTAKDYLRFRRYYHPQGKQFWQQVEHRAQALNTKFNSKKFQKRLQMESDKLNS
jgi:hypothetical protein